MKNNFNIRIKVTTNYLKGQSAPDENRYVFSYTINIKNLGNNSAKLISRQWIITDSNGNIQEVNGDGVVGQQPNINPGEEFTYTSGTIIKTPVGTMEGDILWKILIIRGSKPPLPLLLSLFQA